MFADHPLNPLNLALPRLLLLVNHVLSQEPQAMAKLQPHAGKCLHAHMPTPPLPLLERWLGTPAPLRLCITPAGLFELTPPTGEPALEVTLAWPTTDKAWQMLRTRQRPDMQIAGDARLAEAVSWIAQHIRWDVAADLQQWFGMPAAASFDTVREHLMQTAKRWQADRSQNRP